jgi:hypothetical protein
MIKRNLLVSLAAVAFACAGASQSIVSAQNAGLCGRNNSANLLMVGLTADQRLVCFSEASTGRVRVIGPVSGLSGDSGLIGMDYRVQDGQLYGVGNAGGVYRIDTNTGAATLVNVLTVALDGTSFGVDFNPAADRLRIISNTGQNLRHNVNAGGVTINDGTLTYTAPPASPVAALGVTGAAYTNNDLAASTATTLFDLDSATDQIAIQSPANNGILVATGRLGVDTTDRVGFDIFTTLQGGVAVDNEGFAVLTSADGSSRLYSISLLTGRATPISGFGMGVQIVDIAIPLDQQ